MTNGRTDEIRDIIWCIGKDFSLRHDEFILKISIDRFFCYRILNLQSKNFKLYFMVTNHLAACRPEVRRFRRRSFRL